MLIAGIHVTLLELKTHEVTEGLESKRTQVLGNFLKVLLNWEAVYDYTRTALS